MIFKLFLNDLNSFYLRFMKKQFIMKRKKILDCCYRKCNSVQQKEE